MRDETKRIFMGRITGIYGIKGWLKIESYTRPPDNIFSYKPWYIGRDNDWRAVLPHGGKRHGKGLIVALDGVDDRDVARTYIGADISVFRSQLQKLEPGEYYWHDLLGMQVVDQQGRVLGQLKEIMETGANEVLVVEGEGRHLIPLVWGHYVIDVDQDKGVIRVDWESPE